MMVFNFSEVIFFKNSFHSPIYEGILTSPIVIHLDDLLLVLQIIHSQIAIGDQILICFLVL